MPDEGAVVEQRAVLLEEAVAKPVVQRLAGETGIGKELIEGVEFKRPEEKVNPKRQRAIDRLKKDGKPVTEANITFVEERL